MLILGPLQCNLNICLKSSFKVSMPRIAVEPSNGSPGKQKEQKPLDNRVGTRLNMCLSGSVNWQQGPYQNYPKL